MFYFIKIELAEKQADATEKDDQSEAEAGADGHGETDVEEVVPRKSRRIAQKKALPSDDEDEQIETQAGDVDVDDDGYKRAPPLPQKNQKKRYSCGQCDMSTDDIYSLRRHIKQQHGTFSMEHDDFVFKRLKCTVCEKLIPTGYNFDQHVRRHHTGQKITPKIEYFTKK